MYNWAIFFSSLFEATVETLIMSLMGTLIALFFGLIFALPASGRWGVFPQYFSRFGLGFFRIIPDLILASLVVLYFGLGLMSGIIAIALHTTGVLGRLFSDNLQNDCSPNRQNLVALKATPFQVMLYHTYPVMRQQWIFYILYRLEYNIRMSLVLGLVGAGGLGQMIYVSLSLFQYDKTGILVFIIAGLVFCVEKFSQKFRQQLQNSSLPNTPLTPYFK